MSVLLPLKNCKQMFWGHVKKLQSVDKLLIHWWFLLDNQHQKSAGKTVTYILFLLPTIHMDIQWDMERCKWSLSKGVDSSIFTCIEGSAPNHACWRRGGRVDGGWWVADHPQRCFIQMHTIGRMVVMYTMLGIVGYLLLWKYSCFISSTENNAIKWGLGNMTKTLECWTYSSLVQHM